MTFKEWLRQFYPDDTPAGYFTRTFSTQGAPIRLNGVEDLVSYLEANNATEADIRVGHTLYLEYLARPLPFKESHS
jgi:hypothetical protein